MSDEDIRNAEVQIESKQRVTSTNECVRSGTLRYRYYDPRTETRITMAMKVAWTEYSGRDPPLEVEVGKGVDVELGSSELAEAT